MGDRSRDLKLLHASENLLESPKLKPERAGERSTDSGGDRIAPKLLCDGHDVTQRCEQNRLSVPWYCCYRLTRLCSQLHRYSPHLGCTEREMCGCTERAFLSLPLKSPPWGWGEEEPGVLMQQHPALPALTSALK